MAKPRHTRVQLEELPGCPACEGPGFWSETSPVPGVLARIKQDKAKRAYVERCDCCERYPNDDAARDALIKAGIELTD